MSCALARRVLFVVFEAVAIAAFLVMLGSSLLQVLFRYVFDLPLMWTEELARLMCVFTTYFGSVVVLLMREHIRVDFLDAFLSPRGQKVLVLVCDVLVGWFLVVFAIGCWLMAQATWNTETATMAWFRMAYVYYGVGIAVAAMLIVVLIDVLSTATSLVRGKESVAV
jgi:TRAP-type C4-dicarboxylate transport system permease small subunit